MIVTHQDKEIIYIEQYTWTGEPDGIYIKINHPMWAHNIEGDICQLLLNRNRTIIVIHNQYYSNAYLAIEPSLIGDVLILGKGLGVIDAHLTTGSSWKWVERNDYLCNVFPAPVNGTVHQGDAEDIDFLTTLGTFDTIFIDFMQTKINDYSSLLNPGGTIVEMFI
jgi:hypothetical protein